MIGFGQNVYIPDVNFKAYLVGSSLINTNGDTEIQVSEATAFNGQIHIYGMGISDLTGIEYFTALTFLSCGGNSLTSLDVSNNTALLILWCENNPLQSLDISSNINLNDLILHTPNDNLISLNIKNGNNTNLTCDYIPPLLCGQAANEANLSCIQVDDVSWANLNWLNYIATFQYFSTNCPPPSAIEEHSTNKELLKVTDLLGRETKNTKQPLFYIYDDGTVEKRIIIE